MKSLITLLTVLFSVSFMQAQLSTSTPGKTNLNSNNVKHNGLEVGLLGGTMFYTGDAHCEKFFLKQTNFGGGAFLRYHFTDKLSTRLNLIAGQIKGDDRNYPNEAHLARSFSFTNNLFDVNAVLEWEPLAGKRYGAANAFKKILSPYLNVGIGFVSGKPTVNYNEANNVAISNLIALDKANTKSTFISVPFGAGLRYDLSRRLTIGLEGIMRAPFTDYLDGISQSASPEKRDWYYTGMLNLGYKFNYSRDGDKDGIEDSADACPDVMGIPSAKGCPDRDGDGIIDDKDLCPSEAGIASLGGCPDRDRDGVADKDDACPDTAGEVAYNGCPDRDGDGIIDSKDDCPDNKGTIAFNGCPDSDGDGIADKYDSCPNERGSKADKGCPPPPPPAPVVEQTSVNSSTSSSTSQKTVVTNDGLEISPDAVVVGTFVDNASVVKATDIYENSGRVVVSQGTSEIPSNAVYKGDINSGSSTSSTSISSEDTAVFDEALYGIEFETGSAVIKSSSYGILNRVSSVMSRRSGFNFEISGHTDNVGGEDANLRLSQARAQSVYAYLVKKGIAGSRLTARGYGSTNPVADNGSAAGRSKNRRVQFNVQ